MGESIFSLIRSGLAPMVSAVVLSLSCFVGVTAAQTSNNSAAVGAVNVKGEVKAKPAKALPGFSEYRKVLIGTEASAVKDMWGDPKIEDADGFIYEPSESEMVQIVLDKDKKVEAISVTYAAGVGAPTFETVFGAGVKPETKQNGSVYQMVRYPEAGYWVSYYAGTGDKPTVTLTIQKL